MLNARSFFPYELTTRESPSNLMMVLSSYFSPLLIISVATNVSTTKVKEKKAILEKYSTLSIARLDETMNMALSSEKATPTKALAHARTH
jgi:hypothetical protein